MISKYIISKGNIKYERHRKIHLENKENTKTK